MGKQLIRDMCFFPEHFGLVMGGMRKREVWEKSHMGALILSCNWDPEKAMHHRCLTTNYRVRKEYY